MKLYSVNLGTFKLDGGAMFGVVPKSIWQRTNPADENNLCNWALRLMLIEDGKRLILVDTGMGHKQSEKFFGFYFRGGEHNIDKGLAELGFHRDDITDVFLTHMHFDHVGGAVMYEGDKLVPTFKNATYWSNKYHWDWAVNPNPREKASFLKENFEPLQANGQVQFLDVPRENGWYDTELPFKVCVVNGHTEAQMLPYIETGTEKILYTADLLPSVGHIPLPYVMGYDVRPLETMAEKAPVLQKCVDEGIKLFFEHDAANEMALLKMTEKGARLDHTLRLSDLSL
ncbi:MBL fold metallo-hydrolase [Croceimicrobium sp.]|uniref:MBL fold metallo-hydrolase n=1 Tax=Croceimicrobium sp. TaxID=2828340 RepID=UPI003BAC0AB5